MFSLFSLFSPKKRSNFVTWEQKHLVELVSFGYLSLNLLGWTQKGWRIKTTRWQQLEWDVIGVHSEGCPNIYTRLLMSSDIKVLVWGRLPNFSLPPLRPLPLWDAGLHFLYPLLLYTYKFDMIEKCYILKSNLKCESCQTINMTLQRLASINFIPSSYTCYLWTYLY